MPPSSAMDIVEQANARLADLLHHADALPDYAVSDECGGERLADIFVHLHAWQQRLLGGLASEAYGEAPSAPAAGYAWEQLEQSTAPIITALENDSYAHVRNLLEKSHRELCEELLVRDDDALFDVRARPWLQGRSLGDVAHQCLGRHYQWGVSMLGQCGL